MVALIIIFYQGPCGTFQVMKDHYNDIEHYTPLTVHAAFIISNNDLSKNAVVSIYLHDDLSKNKIPCGTL